jgi:hypothetical protein
VEITNRRKSNLSTDLVAAVNDAIRGLSECEVEARRYSVTTSTTQSLPGYVQGLIPLKYRL